MQIAHIRTDGACNEYDSRFIGMVLRLTDGVRDVASVPSVGLISVLYDERRADRTDVVEAVRSAGFDAHELASSADAPELRSTLTSLVA